MESAALTGELPEHPLLANQILRNDDRGLYCAAGQFHIDPWADVETAIITHAHGDHARSGSKKYHCSADCVPLLRHRLGAEIDVTGHSYGEKFELNEAVVSFHPAGHIYGSSQVRVEAGGKVWVASGDYKRTPDPTCTPFEVVPCDVFITEATFALPIYRWETGDEIGRQILSWWDENIRDDRPAILFCYALGKAQRVLAELYKLDPTRKVYVHGAVAGLTELYRTKGINMLETLNPADEPKSKTFGGELILAPPSAYRSPWMKRFKGADTGFASGWMRVRAGRRRKGYDRGFVLSDHADWNELVQTVRETGAKLVLPTHGGVDVLARYLNEIGIDAIPLRTTAYGEGED